MLIKKLIICYVKGKGRQDSNCELLLRFQAHIIEILSFVAGKTSTVNHCIIVVLSLR